MKIDSLFLDMENSGDAEISAGMRAYMRDQFPFLGIPMPKRKGLCKPYFKAAKAEERIDWVFVDQCWEKAFREFQYVAIDYLVLMQRGLTIADVPKLKELLLTKSWWDTVDGLAKVVGHVALNDPRVNHILLDWSTDENIWLRRVAIDHQLLRKEKTDTKLMEKIIRNNLNQSEFFINKAIGWSLREYSKTNPAWVRGFIERYRDRLSRLSIKEASKHLPDPPHAARIAANLSAD